MGLFGRSAKPARIVEDPAFGPLEYDDSGCWRGDVMFEPVGDEVGIEIKTDGPEPVELHRQLFRQLAEKYASLTPALAQALSSLYAAHVEAEGDEPISTEDLLAATELGWVEILSARELRLGFGFRDGMGAEGVMLVVGIKDWIPRGESVEE